MNDTTVTGSYGVSDHSFAAASRLTPRPFTTASIVHCPCVCCLIYIRQQ